MFFHRDGTNNPSTRGTLPNWFYYWIEDVHNSPVKAQLAGKNCIYAGASPGRFAEYNGNYISPTYSIFNDAVGNEVYNIPFAVNRNGIDVLAASLVHEGTHRIVDLNQVNGIWPLQGSGGDLDGDELPNTLEDARSSFGYDKNMRFSNAFIGFPYGDDEEVYCEQSANGQTGDSTLDWSKDGKQW
ncbi:MAG: hypothetical protein NWQ31_01275 [Polaribacter sp.]|nr:hypothetical protein [Polaribacter sp.]